MAPLAYSSDHGLSWSTVAPDLGGGTSTVSSANGYYHARGHRIYYRESPSGELRSIQYRDSLSQSPIALVVNRDLSIYVLWSDTLYYATGIQASWKRVASPPGASFGAMTSSPTGQIIIGTRTGSVYLLDATSNTLKHFSSGPLPLRITALKWDGGSKLLIGTQTAGLYQVDMPNDLHQSVSVSAEAEEARVSYAEGILTIFSAPATSSGRIIDMTGRTVTTAANFNNPMPLDLVDGVYFVLFESATRPIKFMVRN